VITDLRMPHLDDGLRQCRDRGWSAA
jgi:hypothetical protein